MRWRLFPISIAFPSPMTLSSRPLMTMSVPSRFDITLPLTAIVLGGTFPSAISRPRATQVPRVSLLTSTAGGCRLCVLAVDFIERTRISRVLMQVRTKKHIMRYSTPERSISRDLKCTTTIQSRSQRNRDSLPYYSLRLQLVFVCLFARLSRQPYNVSRWE